MPLTRQRREPACRVEKSCCGPLTAFQAVPPRPTFAAHETSSTPSPGLAYRTRAATHRREEALKTRWFPHKRKRALQSKIRGPRAFFRPRLAAPRGCRSISHLPIWPYTLPDVGGAGFVPRAHVRRVGARRPASAAARSGPSRTPCSANPHLGNAPSPSRAPAGHRRQRHVAAAVVNPSSIRFGLRRIGRLMRGPRRVFVPRSSSYARRRNRAAISIPPVTVRQGDPPPAGPWPHRLGSSTASEHLAGAGAATNSRSAAFWMGLVMGGDRLSGSPDTAPTIPRSRTRVGQVLWSDRDMREAG